MIAESFPELLQGTEWSAGVLPRFQDYAWVVLKAEGGFSFQNVNQMNETAIETYFQFYWSNKKNLSALLVLS